MVPRALVWFDITLPSFPHWKATSASLHKVVSLVGPIHKAILPHRNNYMHFPMGVNPTGLESQTLPRGGKIQVDLKAGSGGDLRGDRRTGGPRSLQSGREGAAGAAPSIHRRNRASEPYGPFTSALKTSL